MILVSWSLKGQGDNSRNRWLIWNFTEGEIPKEIFEHIWQASDLHSAEPIQIFRISHRAFNPEIKEKLLFANGSFSQQGFCSENNPVISQDHWVYMNNDFETKLCDLGMQAPFIPFTSPLGILPRFSRTWGTVGVLFITFIVYRFGDWLTDRKKL